LYNKDRKKIGRLHKRGEAIEDGTYFIVVNVWIVNSKNEVLLAQRHPQKKLWGGLWECSASGSVLAGEDSLQGALRETEEEIGIILPPTEAVLLESIMRENNFRDTFLFTKDISICELKLKPDEVINAKWVTKQEYIVMCNQGLLAPPVQNFWELYSHV
jgi:isopentenyldiphosphate isomerase